MLVVFMVLGSVLREVKGLYTFWNMAVKVLFDPPRETQRYFIEPIFENMLLKSICRPKT